MEKLPEGALTREPGLGAFSHEKIYPGKGILKRSGIPDSVSGMMCTLNTDRCTEIRIAEIRIAG